MTPDATNCPTLVENALVAEFLSLNFLQQEFPMLAQWGVHDIGLTIHSLGLNYLSALGRHTGFWAVTEYPIFQNRLSSGPSEIRGDIVWFGKPEGKVVLLSEFERYEPLSMKRNMIRQKAENLVIAHHHLGNNPRVLLLALWTLTGMPVTGLGQIKTHVRGGFRDSSGNRVPALRQDILFLIATFVLRRTERGLTLGEVLF